VERSNLLKAFQSSIRKRQISTKAKKMKKEKQQNIFRFLRKPKGHCHIKKPDTGHYPVLEAAQFKVVNYSFKIHFNIILSYTPISLSGLFYSGINSKIFIPPMRVICPVSLII
jgi:hypothetical protein